MGRIVTFSLAVLIVVLSPQGSAQQAAQTPFPPWQLYQPPPWLKGRVIFSPRQSASQAPVSQGQPAEEAPGTVERRPYQTPIYRGKLTAGQALEKRSYEIFPRAVLDATENSKRVQWIVAQEQQAIANDINVTKPLLYPVSGPRH